MVEPCAAAFGRSLDIRGGRPGGGKLAEPLAAAKLVARLKVLASGLGLGKRKPSRVNNSSETDREGKIKEGVFASLLSFRFHSLASAPDRFCDL